MRFSGLVLLAVILASPAALAQPSPQPAPSGSQPTQVNAAERAAIAAVRAVVSAQASFASSCGQGMYAANLVDLGKPPAPGVDGYLARGLSSGTSVTREGYLLTMGTSDGAADTSKKSCNGIPLVRGYHVTATPVDGVEAAHQRRFGANTTGAVFYSEGPLKITDKSSDGKPVK
jgi:hypothetical protein